VKRKQRRQQNPQTKLLQDLLIAQLAALGMPQARIQKIVSVDMWRVSQIARFSKRKVPKG